MGGLTVEAMRRVNKKFGIKEVPPDHPVYSGGPSIMFVSNSNENKSSKDKSENQVDADSLSLIETRQDTEKE